MSVSGAAAKSSGDSELKSWSAAATNCTGTPKQGERFSSFSSLRYTTVWAMQSLQNICQQYIKAFLGSCFQARYHCSRTLSDFLCFPDRLLVVAAADASYTNSIAEFS